MSDDFFKLSGKPKEIKDPALFKEEVLNNDTISDIIYWPDTLREDKPHPRLKVERKTFKNVSFAKTTLKNIDFTSCHFEDCLMFGATIDNCKFRQCSFRNVNTHEIKIKRTYLNPNYFVGNYDKTDIGKSNMAVHLFQQILNNSIDEEQSQFARKAKYQFKVWNGRLSQSKRKLKLPYPITWIEFIAEYVPNFIYRWTFGFGLRLRNFIITFNIVFILFYFLNLYFWNDYELTQKDFSIEAFNTMPPNFAANFFYTADVTTQLVDSQFQPCSDFGMFMLTFQGAAGFILFSFLITTLINRFVK